MIRDVDFGGLLKIECPTIPAMFANWLTVECFDAETSELVLPGRGRISVTAQSVFDIFQLPNKGDEVKYEEIFQMPSILYRASMTLFESLHQRSKKY